MAGAFDWLDTLANQVGVVAGKAVDVVNNVATVKATAAAESQDQTGTAATSPLQTAIPGGSIIPWAIGGTALLVAVFLLARRK